MSTEQQNWKQQVTVGPLGEISQERGHISHVYLEQQASAKWVGVLIGRNIVCKGTEVIQGTAFGFWTWDCAELPVLSPVPRRPFRSALGRQTSERPAGLYETHGPD